MVIHIKQLYIPTADHHPHYIFGEKGNKYKSLPLTTTRPDNVAYYTLKKNPNPMDNEISYMPLITPHTAKKWYYGDVLQGWSFSKEDMKEARKRIKRYKKSYNRKPPMWYELKKQRLRQKKK